MAPFPSWYQGREAVAEFHRRQPGTRRVSGARSRPGPNGHPACACDHRPAGEGAFRAMSIDVLLVERGRIAEITAFTATEAFPAFGLPAVHPG